MIEPSWGWTRTEEDAFEHIQRLIESDPLATKWHLVLDNLNIHQSEALVRWIADLEGIEQETLGSKANIAYYNRTMAKPIKWTYTGIAS